MNIMYQDYENIVFVINKKWVLNPEIFDRIDRNDGPSECTNDRPDIAWSLSLTADKERIKISKIMKISKSS